MTQLEKVRYAAKAHTTGVFGLLSRFLVVLFAAAMPLAPSAAVLAQQPAQTGAQAQGGARASATEANAVRPFSNETTMSQLATVPYTAPAAIRPFRINFPEAALVDLRQRAFTEGERRGRLRLIASREGSDGSVTIHQDVKVYDALLAAREEVSYKPDEDRHAWMQVVKGAVTVNGTALGTGDGAGFFRVVADRDDVIEILADELVSRFRAVGRDVNAYLAHRLDGFRSDQTRIDARTLYLKLSPAVVPENSFGHLAPRGVAGAGDENSLAFELFR